MAKKKLTSALKKKIDAAPFRLRKGDYDGDALKYLNRKRGAVKAKKTKAANKKAAEEKAVSKKKKRRQSVEARYMPLHICDTVIQPDTEIYMIIAASARLKKMSIYKYAKQFEPEICKLIKGYMVFFKKEFDDLIDIIQELPESKKTFVPVKGKEIPRVKAVFLLHSFKSFLLASCEVYSQVLIEAAYDLFGNIHVSVPWPIQYTKFECEGLEEFIDEHYPNISYFKND